MKNKRFVVIEGFIDQDNIDRIGDIIGTLDDNVTFTNSKFRDRYRYGPLLEEIPCAKSMGKVVTSDVIKDYASYLPIHRTINTRKQRGERLFDTLHGHVMRKHVSLNEDQDCCPCDLRGDTIRYRPGVNVNYPYLNPEGLVDAYNSGDLHTMPLSERSSSHPASRSLGESILMPILDKYITELTH